MNPLEKNGLVVALYGRNATLCGFILQEFDSIYYDALFWLHSFTLW